MPRPRNNRPGRMSCDTTSLHLPPPAIRTPLAPNTPLGASSTVATPSHLDCRAILIQIVALQLRVFLDYPDVSVDTNDLERSLRPIPTGRRNWLFCWTEMGARRVGVIQSLLVTCKLQGVDPYTCLVDVLQRVGQHPAKRVMELTPRVWKRLFADQPLRSDLDRSRNPPTH